MNQEELISLTQQAIRAKSMSGEEQQVARLLQDKMLEMGYDQVWIDNYGSVIGKISGTGEAPSVLFDGHIDTVPVNSPEKWHFDPFAAEIADGRMYGRGTTDMKGAVCAAVIAIGQIARLKKEKGIAPKGDIYVSGTVYEEVFEGVALGKVLEQVHPDYVVIMESTQLNVNIGQRGRAEVVITAHGKSAHSSNPDVGLNAISEMIPVLENLDQLKPAEHPLLGKGISVVTDIISSPYPGASVVPDLCKITIDRRLLAHEDETSVLKQYQNILPAQGKHEVSVVAAQLQCYTGEFIGGTRFFPGWLLEKEHPLVDLTVSALQGIGQQPSLSTYSFCTNGSYSAGIANIPTIGYGPSRENLAHVVDEYIELDQLIKAAEGYYAIASAITKFASEDGGDNHV